MRSIRSRILTVTFGGLLFVSIVSALATHNFINIWLRDRTVQRGQQEIAQLADYLLDPVLQGDHLAVQEIVQRTASARSDVLYVYVLSAADEVIASSFVGGVPRDILLANPYAENGSNPSKSLATDRGQVLDVATGLLNGRAGEVHMGIDGENIDAIAHQAMWSIQVTGLFALALALLASTLLADIIVRPVEHLVIEMRRVARGDLSGHATIDTNDEIGELGHSFNYMVDQLRQFNKQLRRAAARAQGIVNSFPTALFVIEPTGFVSSANPAASSLTGLHRDELEGRPLSSLFVVGAGSTPVLDIEKLLPHHDVLLSYDLALVQLGGSVTPVAFHSAPMKDDHGKLRGFVVEVRDLGRLHLAIEGLRQQLTLLEEHHADLFKQALGTAGMSKEVEVHLVRSDRLVSVGQLAASVAHEVNNPLFGVLTFARLIERELKNEQPNVDKIKDAARMIADESTRCSEILKRFLGYARQADPTTAVVDVRQCLEEVQALIGKQAEQNNVTIRSELDETVPVTGDANQLRQIFLNLSLNAVQAMAEGGELSFRAAPDGRNLAIEIADTGPGIPPEVMDKVFEPFFTTKGEGVGTGLGLSVARTLVEKHRGQIDIHSTPGEGTTVRVVLPLAELPGAEAPQGEAPQEEQANP